MDSFLRARSPGAGDCTKDTCPAEMSIYGYAPDWGFNFFFTIFFGVAAIVFYHQTLFYPKWRLFGGSCAVGCLMESGGYVGRLLLHKDPFSDIGFKLNVVLLTIAPAFLSAAIYLTLKHATVVFGQHLARMRPEFYLYIFVVCDSISLVLQGAGGAISAMAKEKDLLDDGVDILIAGLVFQVFSLLVFLGLVLDYVNQCRLNWHDISCTNKRMLQTAKFRLFLSGVSLAYLCILARCSYRIAELCHGWGSHIMRKEADFIILESDMIVLASCALSMFYPGVFWPVPDVATTYDEVRCKRPRMDVTSQCHSCGRYLLREV